MDPEGLTGGPDPHPMKSEKKMHKKGHMGDCFGVGPPVCDKKNPFWLEALS